MPEVDGVKFLRRLREEPALRGTPVVVLTALCGGTLVHEAQQLGARHVLLKASFSLEDLVARVVSLAPVADAA
jgi:CheY-like chemotaxis protein